MKKRNKFAKELMTPKYRSRIVKPKKGKGSFKRKKNKYLEWKNYNLAPTCWIILEDKSVPFSRLSLKDKLFIYPCKNPAANKSPAPVRSVIFKFFFASHSVIWLFLIAIAPGG